MAPADEAEVRRLVGRYVDELTAQGAICSPAVRRAFATVQRHRLVETFYQWTGGSPAYAAIHNDPDHPNPEHLQLIYSDTALGTRFVDGWPASSTSQPSLVAGMLELLGLTPGSRVLEIGAGTGYNAALMAELVGDQRLIVTVDVADDVVTQTRRLLAHAGYPGITVLRRDGVHGAAERAPFDRIVATVGCSDLAPAWAEQLADDGLLLVPLAHAGGYPLYLLGNEHGRLQGRVAGWAGFMPVRGDLHVDGLWPIWTVHPDPDADEPIHQRDPWPGFGTIGSPSSPGCADDEIDLRIQSFCFYVSLHDRRACWAPGGVGLSDGLNGWAAAGPDGVRWWRQAALVDELERLHARWLADGRPALGDYRVAFTPIAEGATAPPGGWALDRRFYRELVWLARP
jgi:protein-L-isoaspartate(D-aspartate) O-methyltransferase